MNVSMHVFMYIRHNSKNNNKKPRKPRTKNRLTSQSYKKTNSQTKKNKTARNQITPKKYPKLLQLKGKKHKRNKKVTKTN